MSDSEIQELRERTASLEADVAQQRLRDADQDARIFEQEHRLYAVIWNWFRYRASTPPADATDEERASWNMRRAASCKAIIWRLFAPSTAAAVGGSAAVVISGFGLWIAWRANELLDQQNAKFDHQNALVARQNKYFQDQNAKLQEQISMQANQEYIARRAALFATLYDRKETCNMDEVQKDILCSGGVLATIPIKCEASGKTRCPPKAAVRSREEALRAFTQMERGREPLPTMSTVQGAPEVPRLSLSRIDLAGANLNNAHLQGANLDGAHLEGARLYGAHLEGARLYGAHLDKATLDKAHLQDADLRGAHLRNAHVVAGNLQGADLRDAHLENVNLGAANLRHVQLHSAHLEGANLNGARLQGADLRSAHLEGANLNAAGLEGANLIGATGLNRELLEAAFADKATKLPLEFADTKFRKRYGQE